MPSVPGAAFACLTLSSSAASSAKNSPVPKSAFSRVAVAGHSQSAGGKNKLKRINRLKKKPALRRDLAEIGRKALMGELGVSDFREVLKAIRNGRIAQPFVRRSRKNYHSAIAMALALYYAAQNQTDPIEKLRGLLAGGGYRLRKTATAAHLAVRAVIDYGTTDAERSENRQFVSRDAAAVNHLAERGILPDRVVELGKRKGEGLEAWGRASRRQPTETKHLDSSALDVSRNSHKTENAPRDVHVFTVANDRTKIVLDLRQRDPVFCRQKGDNQTVWALVPAIKLRDTNPTTEPKRTRKLLAIGLKDYAARLRPK
jgi:hypothetical protein